MAKKNPLVSAIIASILSLIIFASLRFFGEWFAATQMNTLLGGFLASILFIFTLTAVSNVEMVVFGDDFQAKLVEIIFCLTLAVIAASVVHRVCATTCILFSLVGLYFVNRISTRYHNRSSTIQTADTQLPVRKGGKRHKQN